MKLNRRKFMSISAGAGASTVLVAPSANALTYSEQTAAAIAEFAGGATATEGKITVNAPEIAENGNTVPIDISVESEMSESNYVKEVIVLADGNPNPGVATFKFSPMSGKAQASTRIRLAKTQDLVAVAKMSDGSVYSTTKSVKVTIGGCGG